MRGRAWERWLGPAEDYRLGSWLFLRLLGVVYLVAFVSLWVQVAGLIGPRGILPAAELLHSVGARLGASRFWWLPSLFWLGAGDGALKLACAAGAVAAVLVVLDLAAAPALAAAWLLYLSLVSVGGDFLSFQWDALLLEAGFLAVLLAPPWRRGGLRPTFPAPSRPVLLLLHWLLLRLMFSSGMVKLLSGDPTWRHLTALSFHYETQPIPNPIAYFVFQLPAGVHRACTAGMFVLELLAPLLILGPRRLKRNAAAGLVALQVLIALTGNFAFFNLLTLALCALLLDDGAWPVRLRRRLLDGGERPRCRAWPRALVTPVAAILLVLSSFQFAATLGLAGALPRPALAALRWTSPLRLTSGYGLFAVMTTTRPEILIEGSADGRAWKPYAFRYKAGDLHRAPPFVAPHQPRLDWQMWFAALGGARQEEWFAPFLQRLLEGSPPVLALLAGNPFPHSPPRYVRALLYDYRFTDLATLRRTGAWWRREPEGAFTPAVTLDAAGNLAVVRGLPVTPPPS